MKQIKRIYNISKQLNLNFEDELRRQIMAYRSTPHTTTGRSPADLAGKLNYCINQLGDSDAQNIRTPVDREEVEKVVTTNKAKNERSGRNIKGHDFVVGDQVLILIEQSATKYDKDIYTITDVVGQTITARNSAGRTVRRNSERFKHYFLPTKDVPPTSDPSGDLLPEADLTPPQKNVKDDPTPSPRQTRSKGPAEEQPWIYSKERTRKKK